MRRVYFIKPSRPYNVGEVAGFPDKTAERLVALEAAIPIEAYEASLKEAEEAEAKEPAPKKRAAKKAAKKSK